MGTSMASDVELKTETPYSPLLFQEHIATAISCEVEACAASCQLELQDALRLAPQLTFWIMA